MLVGFVVTARNHHPVWMVIFVEARWWLLYCCCSQNHDQVQPLGVVLDASTPNLGLLRLHSHDFKDWVGMMVRCSTISSTAAAKAHG